MMYKWRSVSSLNGGGFFILSLPCYIYNVTRHGCNVKGFSYLYSVFLLSRLECSGEILSSGAPSSRNLLFLSSFGFSLFTLLVVVISIKCRCAFAHPRTLCIVAEPFEGIVKGAFLPLHYCLKSHVDVVDDDIHIRLSMPSVVITVRLIRTSHDGFIKVFSWFDIQGIRVCLAQWQ